MFSSLEEWLTYQERLHPRSIDLGLERVAAVLNRLGWIDPPPFLVITVAGTNGKGSCVATLEAILQIAGYHTATYTSPHLLRYNERIRLNGREANDEELCAAFTRIEAARGEISLTYFEYGTLAALDLFQRTRPDVVILEVGLGGRLDATNVLDADVAAVTTVDLDHMDWLGPDRESIGREKAGVFRPGRPAVCGDPNPPVSLVEHAQTLGTPLYIQGRDFGWQSSFPYRGGSWDWWASLMKRQTNITEIVSRCSIPAPRMMGLYQYENAATALMVLECLSHRLFIPTIAVRRALEEVAVPGRFQVLPGSVPHILDVAHNPQAAAALAATLHAMSWGNEGKGRGKTLAVVAMLADKDLFATLGAMAGVVDAWFLASLCVPRGASAVRLAEVLADLGVTAPVGVYADVVAALTVARTLATEGDRIVVFGSFYTVSAVQSA